MGNGTAVMVTAIEVLLTVISDLVFILKVRDDKPCVHPFVVPFPICSTWIPHVFFFSFFIYFILIFYTIFLLFSIRSLVSLIIYFVSWENKTELFVKIYIAEKVPYSDTNKNIQLILY